MPTIAEVRQQYPQYSDMSDSALAGALHQKFYADMPRAEFDKKVGLDGSAEKGRPKESTVPAAIADIPKEISNEATAGAADVAALGHRGEMGTVEGLLSVPKAAAGAVRVVASPVIGAIKSVGGHLIADAETAVGGLINPEVAKQRSESGAAYEDAKKSIDTAMAGARPAGAPVAAPGGYQWAAPAAKPPPLPKAPTEGQEVASAADRVGVDLPRAVTSDSMVVQQAGKVAANVPGAGIPLRRASGQAIDQMDEAMAAARAGYGSSDAATAGQAVKEGVTEAIKSGPIKQKVDQLYSDVDGLVNPATVGPLTNTKQIAEAITARRTNSALPTSKNVAELDEALSRGGLTYDGIKGLRSYFGEMLSGGKEIPQGLSHSEVKQIYGALSKDMRLTIARGGGQDALLAYDKAEKAASRWANIREDLQRVLNVQSEEGIFSRVLQAAGSKSTADIKLLGRVRGAVGPEKWNEVSSALIDRLGRAPDGSFSPDRLLGPSGLGGLSEEGKRMLFRSTGNASHANVIDDIATIAKRWKSLNQFANPSGTSQSVIGGGLGFGALADPISTAGSFLGAMGIAKVLSMPASARSFAAWSRAYENVVKAPTRATVEGFKQASKLLAVNAAKELGTDVEPLVRKIQGAIPADAGNEQKSPEGVGSAQPN